MSDSAIGNALLMPGLTVAQLAKRYHVGPDKIRNWIRKGELRAVNVASRLCGKPRFIITPEALAEFERVRQAAATDAPKPKRRRRRPDYYMDFYPD